MTSRRPALGQSSAPGLQRAFWMQVPACGSSHAQHAGSGRSVAAAASMGDGLQRVCQIPTASVSSAAASRAFQSHTSLHTSVHTTHTASLVLSPPAQPLLLGATAVLGVAAVASATRSFFSTSRSEAEQLLREVADEMQRAAVILAPVEAELQARAEAALKLAQEAQQQVLQGERASPETMLALESTVAGMEEGLRHQQQGQGQGRALGAGSGAALALPASTTAGNGGSSGSSAHEGEVVGGDGARLAQIMGRVQDILAVLDDQEQQHMARQKAAAATAVAASFPDVQQVLSSAGADTASPPRPTAAAPTAVSTAAASSSNASSASFSAPSPWEHSPAAVSASPSHSRSPDRASSPPSPSQAGVRLSPSTMSMATASATMQATRPASPPLTRQELPSPSPPRSPSPRHDRSSSSPSSPSSPQALPPPSPRGPPAPLPLRVEELWGLSLYDLKCRLLDELYGTARGVNAGQEQRAWVEELVCALEARNPNPIVTDAVERLHGRWKLVYTTNQPTLTLLSAIQSVPLVDIGDVYQVVDGATLTVHNKIDLALPVILSLRADSGLEVRTPHSFKLRFHRMGLDTYVQTPQLLVSLDLPDSISMLGQTLDLTPLKHHVIAPVQSGLSTATDLLRRAASPELDLPAVEGNALWMLTTYLDDTIRISRDDAGSMFVMLRDV